MYNHQFLFVLISFCFIAGTPTGGFANVIYYMLITPNALRTDEARMSSMQTGAT